MPARRLYVACQPILANFVSLLASMVNLVEYLLDCSILGQNRKIISQGLMVNDPKLVSLFA
jgi:hypothetical protein